MLTMGVGESKTVYLDEDGGEVTFTRLQYGTDMLYKKMDPDFLPSSVFIECAHALWDRQTWRSGAMAALHLLACYCRVHIQTLGDMYFFARDDGVYSTLRPCVKTN